MQVGQKEWKDTNCQDVKNVESTNLGNLYGVLGNKGEWWCHSISTEAIKTGEQSNAELVEPKFRKLLMLEPPTSVYCCDVIVSCR